MTVPSGYTSGSPSNVIETCGDKVQAAGSVYVGVCDRIGSQLCTEGCSQPRLFVTHREVHGCGE